MPALFILAPTSHATDPFNNGAGLGGGIFGSEVVTYEFDAEIGESILLSVARSGGTEVLEPSIEVFGPSDDLIAADTDAPGGEDAAIVSFIAPESGTHRLTVRAGSQPPFPASFRVDFVRAPGTNDGGALSGAENRFINLVEGEFVAYEFTPTENATIILNLFDISLTSDFRPRIDVFDPEGSLFNTVSSERLATMTLIGLPPLTHTLVVRDGFRGDAQFVVLDFTQIPGANDGGTLEQNGLPQTFRVDPRTLAAHQFAMNEGESFVVTVTRPAESVIEPRIRVFDPEGTLVSGAAGELVAAIETTAQISGNYTLIVENSDPDPALDEPYRVDFSRIPGVADGGPTDGSGNIVRAMSRGEVLGFQLAATAGDIVSVGAVETNVDSFSPRVRIFDPSGAPLLTAVDAEIVDVEFVAPSSGDYTVILSDSQFNDPGDVVIGFFVDPDPDSDGIGSFSDNCPDVANANQLNSDTDELGNACDDDDDNDGLTDSEEATLGTNPILADSDGDGFSDFDEVEADSDPTDSGDIPLMAGLGIPILKAALDSQAP